MTRRGGKPIGSIYGLTWRRGAPRIRQRASWQI